MNNKNSTSAIKAEKMNSSTVLEEEKVYQTKVNYDENGNWSSIKQPHIFMNHALGFQWQNTDEFSELKNSKNGAKKVFIFKVIKIDIEYMPLYEEGVKTEDLWIDSVICRIIKIK